MVMCGAKLKGGSKRADDALSIVPGGRGRGERSSQGGVDQGRGRGRDQGRGRSRMT